MAGHAPSEHHHGDMNINEQARTYHSFLVATKWLSLLLIVGVLFFSLLFAVRVGFMGSAATSFVVLVLGIIVLKEKKKAPH